MALAEQHSSMILASILHPVFRLAQVSGMARGQRLPSLASSMKSASITEPYWHQKLELSTSQAARESVCHLHRERGRWPTGTSTRLADWLRTTVPGRIPELCRQPELPLCLGAFL